MFRPPPACDRPIEQPSNQPSDAGAAAVEFALVGTLLFTLIFGVIQYGYGFFQMQALASAAHESARNAQVGLLSCADFISTTESALSSKGLSAGNLEQVQVTYADAAGSDQSAASRGQFVRVGLSYRPVSMQLPFVPFPTALNTSTQVLVEDIGPLDTPFTWTGTC